MYTVKNNKDNNNSGIWKNLRSAEEFAFDQSRIYEGTWKVVRDKLILAEYINGIKQPIK